MSPDLAPYDLLVVGGGINGTGIACDAAGRGLKVALVEQADLAQATSSASSKLIHGGLRYLEHYEFRLVRESLRERDVMLAKAPHLVRPLDFVLPHSRALRPKWMIRLGLWLYDLLAESDRLPSPATINLRRHPAGEALKGGFETGFTYPDCWVDDARLVVANAVAAAEHGADILTRTRLTSAKREGGVWVATIDDGDAARTLSARALINAAGPWVGRVLKDIVGVGAEQRIRLVKGSHIVVPRLHDLPFAYILQNVDRRVVFVLPFENRFSLIGTTDLAYDGDLAAVSVDDVEIAYLCDAAARYMRHGISPRDVVWKFAGVRPLLDDKESDPSKVTRDYVLELNAGDDGRAPPLLSIFGGKLTTYRRLAEAALGRLQRFFPEMGRPWTESALLPGGDVAEGDVRALVRALTAQRRGFDPEWLARLVARHGSRADEVLGDAKAPADLGMHYGGGLYAREVGYLVACEWARGPEDVLWRRTKCGLHMTETERQAFSDSFAAPR